MGDVHYHYVHVLLAGKLIQKMHVHVCVCCVCVCVV